MTWYLDFSPNGGSVADDGADAKVTAIPSKLQTFWESSRWDVANGKFAAGAKPAAGEDAGGAHWTLRLADLGIARPATVRIWVVSLYKSYNGVGTLLEYSDKAGPGSVQVTGGSGRGRAECGVRARDEQGQPAAAQDPRGQASWGESRGVWQSSRLSAGAHCGR